MTGQLISRPTSAPDNDYSYGRHEQWECMSHEMEQEHHQKTGEFWSFDYRKKWLERYFTITPHTVAHEIRECGVCGRQIAERMLSGDAGRKATQELQKHLRDLTRRLAGKLGGRKRHIDLV